MTTKIRLSGKPAEIAALIEYLKSECEVAGGERTYPNRGAFGVRANIEVRTPNNRAQRVRSERVEPIRTELEP